jgi:uncharacterized protein
METSKQSYAPLTERAEILDVLRGFALLGIIMANFYVFSLFTFIPPETMAAFPTARYDQWMGYFHFAFIGGKFYTIFSLLFGIGFAVIFTRRQQAGKNAMGFFYRRILILAIIGLAHSFLLWDGDILITYALVGMLLPLFRNVSDRTLFAFVAFLLFSPLIFNGVKVLSAGKWDLSMPLYRLALATDAQYGIAQWEPWLGVKQDYTAVLQWYHGGFYWRWGHLLGDNRLPKVLGIFMMGLYIGRKGIYQNLNEYTPIFRSIQKYGFLIGIPCTLMYAYLHFTAPKLPHPAGMLETLFYTISQVPLALAYVASIALWWQRPALAKYLKIFSPAGKMALTNYLMQSVIGVTLFYGIGLGWGGKIGPTYFVPLAIGVFALQILYSKVWLSYYQYGPMEWLWRCLTYGKILKLSKNPLPDLEAKTLTP